MNAVPQFVFGYGSLAARHDGCHVARLHGHRRTWGVAMDNGIDLPGYKSYRLRADASRPAVFVAFLDIEADAASTITGLCVPVDELSLRELDDRERNYDRIEVSGAIESARGIVWAYRGSAAGRARLRTGAAAGRAAVSRDYLDDVLAALREIAPSDEATSVQRLVGDGRLAVLDLERFDIGGDDLLLEEPQSLPDAV